MADLPKTTPIYTRRAKVTCTTVPLADSTPKLPILVWTEERLHALLTSLCGEKILKSSPNWYV